MFPSFSSVPKACRSLRVILLPLAFWAASTNRGAAADTDELIAEVDKALSGKREPLKPPLLIFPVVDADDRVTDDGTTLSYMATFAAVYTPQKRLDVCVPLTRNQLHEEGCDKAKTRLERGAIQRCLNALGIKLHAFPKLAARDDGETLTIVCRGDGDKYRDKTFTHTLARREHRKIPGLLAQSVLEYLGVDLTPEEKKLVLAPQLRTEKEVRAFADIDTGRKQRVPGGAELLKLLKRNPRCVAGWELALISHASRVEAMRRFHELQPPLECPRLHLAVAVQTRELGEPDRALRMLLPFAASHRGDDYYHSTVMKCGRVLKDDRLTRHLLDSWRKEAPGYAGCVMRAEQLIDWAWEARGNGFANTITPEGGRLFGKRLLEAARELEKGLRINPTGYTAHVKLLTVARGLGLPDDFMEAHFRAAVKLRPHALRAYEMKMLYLQPRWHGSPEEMMGFARECVATGLWEDRIPQLFCFALKDCSSSPRDAGLIAETLKEPAMWDATLAYYRAAAKGGDSDERRRALNLLVKTGIYGEHFDEVLLACQKLRGPDRISSQVFPDLDELEFLYDLVHARTGKLMTRLRSPRRNDLGMARTAVALAEGDCEAAAKAIEKIKAGDSIDLAKAAAYRAALAVGRKLKRDKRIDLQGAEGLEAFLGARPNWKHSGGKFVCEIPANSKAMLTFPFGIRHGVLRGTLEWTEGISYAQIVLHTRALRDQTIVRYLPGMNHNALLVRNNVRMAQAPYKPGHVAFQFTFTGERDLLQADFGANFQAPVYDDVPGGFSIQVYTVNRPATVTVSDLHIDLTD